MEYPYWRLQKVAVDGDVNGLYKLLSECPELLNEVEKRPVVNTPIHLALSADKPHFAVEVANLKPSVARKLSPDGLTPMHLALKNGQLQVVRGLMAVDPELIRVKGRDGMTPLHFIATLPSYQWADLITELLVLGSSSKSAVIDDLTCRCETALHIALKNKNLGAFRLMLGWSRRVRGVDASTKLLNQKDVDGNTVLHLAMDTRQPELEVIKALMRGGMDINAANSEGLTALDLLYTHMRDPPSELKRMIRLCGARRASEKRDWRSNPLNEMKKNKEVSDREDSARNALLVVAILIATATYQAILSPPGGVWVDSTPDHRAGQWILKGWPLALFLCVNTAAFLSSVGMILGMVIVVSDSVADVLATALYPLSATYGLTVVVGAFPSMPRTFQGIVGAILLGGAALSLYFYMIVSLVAKYVGVPYRTFTNRLLRRSV